MNEAHEKEKQNKMEKLKVRLFSPSLYYLNLSILSFAKFDEVFIKKKIWNLKKAFCYYELFDNLVGGRNAFMATFELILIIPP